MKQATAYFILALLFGIGKVQAQNMGTDYSLAWKNLYPNHLLRQQMRDEIDHWERQALHKQELDLYTDGQIRPQVLEQIALDEIPIDAFDALFQTTIPDSYANNHTAYSTAS